MKKSFVINDIVWITLSALVCIGGLKLGFGTFQRPHAGFMPFLSGLLLGLLALLDLIFGLMGQWKAEFGEKDIWGEINYGKVILTLAVLFVYAAFFTTLGFLIVTILLLFFLFQMMEPRPYWSIFVASVVTTALFYLGFKIGLDSQLPRGLLGF